MALAFKEWSWIVDALGKGKQSIIIRKGGISEEGGDFNVKGKKFFLFPTLFHQAKEMIKEDWLPELNGDHFHTSNNRVKIEFFAEVIHDKLIKEFNVFEKLDSRHAWKKSVIEERFNRWEKSAHLLILQVYRLPSAFELELLPQYGGCKSWIELEGAPEFAGVPVINQEIKGRY